MRDQFEMPRTGKDSKETVSFPNLVLIIDERWRQLFPALQVHQCVNRSPITALLYPICETLWPWNSAQPFRPSLESLFTRYFPKNDSSAAGVRWTELMFRRIRSLTEEVAFEENDWILMSLSKKNKKKKNGNMSFKRFWQTRGDYTDSLEIKKNNIRVLITQLTL